MEKFFSKIRPLAAFIGLGLLGLHLILELVYEIGYGVGAVEIICWIIGLLLAGVLVVAYFLKKEELFKVTLGLLLAFYGVGVALHGLSMLGATGGTGELVFFILCLICAVAALALFLLRVAFPAIFDKPLFKLIMLALIASVVLFGFIGSIFIFVEAGQTYADGLKAYNQCKKNGYDGCGYYLPKVWPVVIATIDTCIVLPAAFLFGFFIHESY